MSSLKELAEAALGLGNPFNFGFAAVRDGQSALNEQMKAILEAENAQMMRALGPQLASGMQNAAARAIAPIPAPIPPLPTATAVLAPDIDREFMTEYQALAKKIGYHCPEADRELAAADLVEFLHTEGITAYDLRAVTDYMDAVVLRMNEGGWGPHAWGWFPLRNVDCSRAFSPPPYSKRIPMPVLLTIEKLVDKFGASVRLEVSDIYTVPKADPFLAVSVPGGERYVIERWDEPGFRGVKA